MLGKASSVSIKSKFRTNTSLLLCVETTEPSPVMKLKRIWGILMLKITLVSSIIKDFVYQLGSRRLFEEAAPQKSQIKKKR